MTEKFHAGARVKKQEVKRKRMVIDSVLQACHGPLDLIRLHMLYIQKEWN